MRHAHLVAIPTLAAAASLAHADLLVEPEALEAGYEYMLLRQPGDPISGSREHVGFEPRWGSASGGHFSGGGTSSRHGAGGFEYSFFKTIDGEQNTISGTGYAIADVWLANDEGELTSASGASHTMMRWDVIEPVTLTLSGFVSISDVVMEGEGIGSAQAGLRFQGRGLDEVARLDRFADDVASFDWTLSLSPGTYTLEAWAYSLALSQGLNAQIAAEPEYSFRGEFFPIPSPGAPVVLALLCSRAARRSTR
ncbi:MAG TPA: hypothetical protein VFF69_12300 [Phycisphaerales bacterium]|nr:hypothetical protein [Phycisphaerales bacterium]